MALVPDFTFTESGYAQPEKFDYIHRKSAGAEIYFVINRTNKTVTSNFTFRVTGKQPELWNPVTGEDARMQKHLPAGRWQYYMLPLEMDAFGSWFRGISYACY